MVKNNKPSLWRKRGIDLLEEVVPWYPDCELDTLARELSQDAVELPKIKARLLSIAGDLNACLHYDTRPKTAEKRAAFNRLAAALSKARQAFDGLDPDSIVDLREVAPRVVPFDARRFPEEFGPRDKGRELVSEMSENLDRLAELVEEARPGPGNPGRPRASSTQSSSKAILELVRFYGKTWGRSSHWHGPRGKLLRFAERALRPVLDKHGLSHTLENSFKVALHEERHNKQCVGYGGNGDV